MSDLISRKALIELANDNFMGGEDIEAVEKAAAHQPAVEPERTAVIKNVCRCYKCDAVQGSWHKFCSECGVKLTAREDQG